MFTFVKCPCCAGHEALSQKSVDALEGMLSVYLDMHPEATELYNILNAIRNAKEPDRTVICGDCGFDIDPNCCWCGESKDDHTSEHSFVPMGCTCHNGTERRKRAIANLLG